MHKCYPAFVKNCRERRQHAGVLTGMTFFYSHPLSKCEDMPNSIVTQKTKHGGSSTSWQHVTSATFACDLLLLQVHAANCSNLLQPWDFNQACSCSSKLLPNCNSQASMLCLCWCRYTVLRPRFSTQMLGEDARLVGYRSSAVLPNNSPVRIAEGQVQRTRALAQASASLEACKQLHQV